jgi:hypothetical protein
MKDFYSLIKIGIDLGNIRCLLLTEMQNKIFSNKKKKKKLILLIKKI